PHKHTNGKDSGSRKRGKGKRGNQDSGSSSAVSAEPTQHQRESAANAVAAMASASKAATEKSGGQAVSENRNRQDAAAAQGPDAGSTAGSDRQHRTGAEPGSQQEGERASDRQLEGHSRSGTAGAGSDEGAQTQAGTSSAGRRRRRAASRPAGPPV